MIGRKYSICFDKQVLWILFFLLTAGYIQAHPVVVYPEGGEQFQAGQYITLQWEIAIEHEQEDWDLYFSPDGGLTWEPIVMDLEPDVLEYIWKVPDISTDRAHFRIVMDNIEGITDYEDVSNAFSIEGENDVTAITGESAPEFSLTNSPNPFRTKTLIRFRLDRGSEIFLDVINAAGTRIINLTNSYFEKGSHELIWDAAGAASGIYFCRLFTSEGVWVRRMILIR